MENTSNTTTATPVTSTVDAPTVFLAREYSSKLPSQVGARGRPRVCGRVFVHSASDQPMNDSQAESVRRELGKVFGINPMTIARYKHDDADGILAFRVPTVEKDTQIVFCASFVG